MQQDLINLMQGPQIFGPLHHAAAAGDDLPVLPGKAGGLRGLQLPEACLPLSGKDVRDAAPVGLDDRVVQVHEGAAQMLCKHFAEGGLAGAGRADDGRGGLFRDGEADVVQNLTLGV